MLLQSRGLERQGAAISPLEAAVSTRRLSASRPTFDYLGLGDDEEMEKAFNDIVTAMEVSKKLRFHGRVTPELFRSVVQQLSQVLDI